jgi:PAS domain S-box-containing protein
MDWTSHTRQLQYAAAVAGIVLATVTRLLLDPVLEDTHPFLTYYLAIVLIAWACDLGPTVLAILLGAVAATYFFLSPRWSTEMHQVEDRIALGVFVFFGAITAALSYKVRRARERLEREQRKLEEEVVQRRQAQEEAQRQWEGWRITLLSIGDAVIVTDASGRVKFLNRVAEGLTGWTQQEAAGQPLETVFHIVDEVTRQAVENPVKRVLETGTVVGLTNHTLLINKSGAERPIDDSAALIRGPTGHIRGVVLVFRDNTERRRAESALRDSARIYRAIGESIDYGVWISDREGRNIYTSESFLRLVGLTEEQCSAFGWSNVLHPDEAEATVAAWKECVKTGQSWDREHRYRGVDGKWHPILSRGVPVKDERGEVLWWAGINLDISRIKTVEEALREADRRKDEFLAVLAHELRNPLAPIRNALHVLRFPGAGVETFARMRDMMERQVRQMARLVDDLLDVSRIGRGKIELRRERLDLAAVVQSALETSRPLIEAGKHELTVSLPNQPVYVTGDQTRLSQVLANLLNNAAKYTTDGGHVWLTARLEGDEAVVRVRDNGAGILAEMLPHVFEMFTQAGRLLDRSDGGLGIGLTLVRRLVELHGGTVEAISAGAGRGSEFIVRLPSAANAPDGPPQKRHGQEAEEVFGSPPRRILVVDDNLDSAESLATLLQFSGHEVRVAHDGPGALAAAKQFLPDVVLLDIGMPGMSGYQVARRLREEPALRHMTLVAQTGWGQEEDRRRAKDAGFDHHLVKPVVLRELHELIARLPAPPA